MITEIWKDIKGFEGRYAVSSLGNVKGLPRSITYSNGGIRCTTKEFILGKIFKKTGYFVVTPSNGKERKQTHIHRLVAEAFIPNPNNLPQVNHINGIKTDNRVENLEWCTPGQNSVHAYRTGLKLISDKQRAFIGRYSKEVRSRKVIQMDMHGNVLNQYPSLIEASKNTGAHQSAIGQCCRGEVKHAKNFKFIYAN